jgi:hypothetical protein
VSHDRRRCLAGIRCIIVSERPRRLDDEAGHVEGGGVGVGVGLGVYDNINSH